jgi:DNA replication factor GINS
MDIDELLIILEKSRTGKLTKIDDDFYLNLRKRISELESMRNGADEMEISRIDDEIRTLRRLHRRIFEARTSKIVRAAWATACHGESAESIENLISGEKTLLTKLIDVIIDFRDNFVFGEKDEVNEDVRGVEEEIEKDTLLVRVKTNIPEFEGIDGKTYKLSREDVVTLPSLNAKALIKADAVELIEVNKE